MTAPLLELRDVEVIYQRAIWALYGVSLTVKEGDIVAILGADGAGKTTTLRAISGFIGLDNARISGGSVQFEGEPIANRPPYQITRLGLALVPERDKIFPNLTVAENLEVVGSRANGAERRRLEDLVFEYFPRLGTMRKREAGLLSGGERQMLALGAAIVCSPRLLMIDELSLGLAPVIVEDIAKRLKQIRAELGFTVLLVEQSAAVAFKLADHAYVLAHGKVVLSGTAAELQANDQVQSVYLGNSAGERRSYKDVHLKRMRDGR
jgi:branched-chain amino acid transport system ATP-binding protein